MLRDRSRRLSFDAIRESIPYHAEVEYHTEGKVRTPPNNSEGAKKHRKFSPTTAKSNGYCFGDQSSLLQEWEATPTR